eukprot:COSAG02_NODE_10126_length_2015_cov_1.431106_2_plen_159_part_00
MPGAISAKIREAPLSGGIRRCAYALREGERGDTGHKPYARCQLHEANQDVLQTLKKPPVHRKNSMEWPMSKETEQISEREQQAAGAYEARGQVKHSSRVWVSIRVPAWSKKTVLRVDGDSIATPAPVHKSQPLEIIGCLLSLVPPLPHDSMVHVGARL